jgi:hypothetical protein
MSIFLGCLSPYEMLRSQEIGNYAAAFAIGITVALVFLAGRERSFGWLPLYAVLLLIHPAWTMSVMTGDCGFAKRSMSLAASVLFVLLVGRQIFFPRLAMYRFLFLIAALSLAIWFAQTFFLRFTAPFIATLLGTSDWVIWWGGLRLLCFGVAAAAVATLLYWFPAGSYRLRRV